MIKQSFTDLEAQIVKELFAQRKKISEIADVLGRTSDSVGAYIRRQGLVRPVEEKKTECGHRKSLSINSLGERTITDMVVVADGEDITPELAMKMHGIDSKEWEVVSFTSNSWDVQNKDGEKLTNTQFKIVVRPRRCDELSIEMIDDYFKNADFTTKKPMKQFSRASGVTLEIDYADAHCGLLSWAQETGENYDLNIVKERFNYIIEDIVDRCCCSAYPIKEIIFTTLGDILHIDNGANTTTAGTAQTVDGRVPKIFNTAVNMMMYTIDMLLSLGVPIKYIFVQGNHSRNLEYCLAKALELAYRKNPNITFDVSPNPQKAVVIGNTLVGLCHGDIPRKNIGKWLQRDFRKEYGNTRFAEVHCGHQHEECVKSDGGVLVKTLPAICESSNWEHEQGYAAQRGVMCFLWDDKQGLKETWYNYL